MNHTHTKSAQLGLWMLIALVIGNMVGSGIFLLPSSLALYGSISIFAWIFTSIGAMLIAIVFSRLSILLPKAGGPYAYCHEAFGEFIGFLIAYIYWIYNWVGNAAIATSMVSYLSFFYPVIAENNLLAFTLIVASVWLLTLLNVLGVAKAGAFQVVSVLLKIIPLTLIIVYGIFSIKFNYFHDLNVTNGSNFLALSGSATLTLWALTGVESASVPAGHIKNPERNIPLATILGTLVAILLYIVGTIVVMGVIPMKQLANSTAPFAEVANTMMGHKGGMVIAIAAIISSLGALNGWILLQGQVPYAASTNGVFPRFFAKLSRFNTPINAIVVSSILITLLLAMNFNKGLVAQFTSIISLATISVLFVYGATVISEVVILIKQKNYHRFYKKMIINILAFAYILWALYGSDFSTILYSLILATTGIPLFWFSKRRTSTLIETT